jgi:hypothetical protein
MNVTLSQGRFCVYPIRISMLPRPSRLGSANDQGSEERSRAMLIIGCDFHTRYEQVAMLDRTA